MDNRTPNNQIRYSLDVRLSGIIEKPGTAQRVLRQARGEVKVKKKLSVAFVLVIVLVLVAIVALAATVITAAQEKALRYTIEQEVAQSYAVETWSVPTRIALMDYLIEADFPFPADTVKAFQNETSIEKKNALVTDLLTALYGRADLVGQWEIVYTIIGNSFELWNYADKAWYYGLAEEYELPFSKHEKYAVPQPDDVQYDAAVILASSILKEKYNLTETELDNSIMASSFAIYPDTGDDFVWLLEFHNPTKMSDYYAAFLSRNGKLIACRHPGQEFQFENAEYKDESRDAIPDDSQNNKDITEEQAIIFALGTFTEMYGYSEQEASRLQPTARFYYDPEFCYGVEPVWLISFADPDTGTDLYKVLLGYDGSFIEVAKAKSPFINPYRKVELIGPSGLELNEKGESFYYWSIEEKAAFYEQWISLARKYEQENPYLVAADMGPFMWKMTRRVWGLPGNEDISQEKALEIAYEAAKDLGATYTLLNRLINRQFYFDVTDLANPQWRIVLHRLPDNAPRQEGDGTRFFIKIDARTGKVINAQRGGVGLEEFISKP